VRDGMASAPEPVELNPAKGPDSGFKNLYAVGRVPA